MEMIWGGEIVWREKSRFLKSIKNTISNFPSWVVELPLKKSPTLLTFSTVCIFGTVAVLQDKANFQGTIAKCSETHTTLIKVLTRDCPWSRIKVFWSK